MKKNKKKPKHQSVSISRYGLMIAFTLALILTLGIGFFWMQKHKIPMSGMQTNNQVISEALWQQPDTALLWTRCSLGMQWQNNTCVGQAVAYTWQDAQKQVAMLNQQNYLGYQDWRLAHIAELQPLVHCSSGFDYQTSIPDLSEHEKTVKVGCQGQSYQRPTIDHTRFPQAQSAWYWSATPYKTPSGLNNKVWGAYLSSGFVYDLNQETLGYVLLVRDQS